jgi:hypothetical protein
MDTNTPSMPAGYPLIGIQMRTKTIVATHCGAMVLKSGLKIAENGCFY